jgi:hypothetical protein
MDMDGLRDGCSKGWTPAAAFPRDGLLLFFQTTIVHGSPRRTRPSRLSFTAECHTVMLPPAVDSGFCCCHIATNHVLLFWLAQVLSVLSSHHVGRRL